MNQMLIQQAQNLYCGFWIEQPVGNNAFSFDQRSVKKIFVPPLISGTINNVQLGQEPAFVEVEDGHEHVRTGLKNFIYWNFNNKPIFIFDNHNHAFFFWLLAFKGGVFKNNLFLVHVDQHTDVWEPPNNPGFSLDEEIDLKKVFEYTNFTLNVGTFIKPAMYLGLFSDLFIINNYADYNTIFEEPFVLDIDLDIFEPNSSVLDDSTKIIKIRNWLKQAVLITIASSPFFIDQSLALKRLKEIFTM